MNNTDGLGTMYFIGSIEGHQVKILLDGGSDDSFIKSRVVHFLQLFVLPTDPFKGLAVNSQSLQV